MKFSTTNFLEFFHKKKRERQRFYLFLRILLYVFAIIVISSLTLSGFYFWTARDVYNLAQSGKRNLEFAMEQAEKLDFEKTLLYLEEAQKNFEEAEARFQEFKFFEKVPRIKDQLEAISNLLTVGIKTASALRDVVRVANEIMKIASEVKVLFSGISLPGEEVTFAEITPLQKKEILQKIFESVPHLEDARAKINLALSSLEQIKKERVASQILEAMEPTHKTLIKIQTNITKIIPIAEILPQVAGYPEAKTYLFLLQNSDEMRPTGGFIGTFGIVKVQDGDIKVFKTENIYALDGPAEKFLKVEPPAPIKKYLRVPYWFMRDSNWFPDFPTSAAKAEWFYQAQGGPEKKIDAVIAITPTVIKNLLREIGNVELNGEIFTPDNLMEVLQYKVEKEYYEKGIPEIQRKDIVGDLANKILERLVSLPLARWPDIWRIAEQSLKEKLFLVWSKDPTLQTLILKEGWGGEVKEFDGDYFMVINANLASLKTDSVMDKKIKYFLEKRGDGKIYAKVEITYKNKGTFTWKTTRYRTYTRVYVPLGSVFVKGSGMMENDKISDPLRRPGKVDVKEEFGKTYFGAFISIEPKEERVLSFEYILPKKIQDQIDNGLYKLFVQKQAGTLGHPLTLDLNFGKRIKYALPAEEEKEWGDGVYKLRTDLKVDREFRVGF